MISLNKLKSSQFSQWESLASCELRVASCELRVASCELRVASCELRVIRINQILRQPEFISGSIFSIMDPDLRQDDNIVIVYGDNPTTEKPKYVGAGLPALLSK